MVRHAPRRCQKIWTLDKHPFSYISRTTRSESLPMRKEHPMSFTPLIAPEIKARYPDFHLIIVVRNAEIDVPDAQALKHDCGGGTGRASR